MYKTSVNMAYMYVLGGVTGVCSKVVCVTFSKFPWGLILEFIFLNSCESAAVETLNIIRTERRDSFCSVLLFVFSFSCFTSFTLHFQHFSGLPGAHARPSHVWQSRPLQKCLYRTRGSCFIRGPWLSLVCGLFRLLRGKSSTWGRSCELQPAEQVR